MWHLNRNYTFERFVVGPCNQFAYAAAFDVAKRPCQSCNPLYICGECGLGKTHLLHAAALSIAAAQSRLNLMYLSAEIFMNELIAAIRDNQMPAFRTKYRHIDCLFVDNIQYLAGKEGTQEEFLNIFKALHDSGKQIVIAGNVFPGNIHDLDKCLRSRFQWGLIAVIHPPEMETRVAIIQQIMQENRISIPDHVSLYIAEKIESNIGELRGFLSQIIAYSANTEMEINKDLVRQVVNMNGLHKLFGDI